MKPLPNVISVTIFGHYRLGKCDHEGNGEHRGRRKKKVKWKVQFCDIPKD